MEWMDGMRERNKRGGDIVRHRGILPELLVGLQKQRRIKLMLNCSYYQRYAISRVVELHIIYVSKEETETGTRPAERLNKNRRKRTKTETDRKRGAKKGNNCVETNSGKRGMICLTTSELIRLKR